MRVLAIDHGTEKMGFAISDDTGKFAVAIPQQRITKNGNDVSTALTVLNQYKPELIVVGYPLGLSGKPTQQSRIIDNFIRLLSNQSHLELVRWEESYSSEQAKVIAKAKGSRQIDSESARLILQEYLDFKNTGI